MPCGELSVRAAEEEFRAGGRGMGWEQTRSRCQQGPEGALGGKTPGKRTKAHAWWWRATAVECSLGDYD